MKRWWQQQDKGLLAMLGFMLGLPTTIIVFVFLGIPQPDTLQHPRSMSCDLVSTTPSRVYRCENTEVVCYISYSTGMNCERKSQ